MDHMERYHQWLADPAIDEATKEDLRKIAADEKEIKERFYKDLEFGTGGLRGIIGAGSNRLNRYTVGRATQGLANYILKEGTQDKGVAIAYDSRHMSPEFAQIAGLVLAGNGIRAYVYPSLRPTPMLSFAVRELGCTAGIVITASHNPPEYNGYKVYWADGAQVVAPRDKDIIAEVNAVASFGEIKEMAMDEAQAKGLFQYISEGVDNAFDANVLAQKLAEEKGADIIVGTDPDCDRVGAMVRNDKGEYVVLTGNMTGALLTEYILSQKKAKGTLPENGAVIKTIVSTEMIRPMCEAYGVELMDVLTGFKFIGEKIKGFEETGSHSYIFGFEESYGCLAGTYARDKDAVVATLLICEMAAYYKKQGMTLYDGLMALYEKYGYYREGVKSLTMKGLDGVEKIQKIMASFRAETPAAFAGVAVEWAKDYKTQVFKNLTTGEEMASPLPVSDVVYYTLADGSWICVRPSGTEPKLKFYIGVKGDSLADAQAKIDALEADIDAKVAAV